MGWQETNQAALLAARAGDYARAESLWLQALEQFGRREDDNLLLLLDNIARHYRRVGNDAKAEALMKLIVETSRRVHGGDSPAVAKGLMDLADLLAAEGREDEATPLLEEALAIWDHRLGPAHLETGRCLKRLAALDKESGRYASAEERLRRALPIFERNFDSRHAEIARLYNELALVTMYQEKFEEAERLFMRQFEIWKQATNSKRPDIAKSLNDLAIFYFSRNEPEKARKAARKAVDLSILALGPKNMQAARGHNLLGICSATEGRYPEAKEHFESALHIVQETQGSDHPLAKEIWDNIARMAGVATKRK